MRIGIDLDNTLVDYSKVLTEEAYRRRWIKSVSVKSKSQIRDLIISLPGGQQKWIQLQGLVYGELINNADITTGALEFIAACRSNQAPVFIISQKTQNLRKAAFGWLEREGFFDSQKLGLDKTNVFFEDTIEAKIQRIIKTKCTHFIDDLEKVLVHPDFPRQVYSILFTQDPSNLPQARFKEFSDWRHIKEALFNHADSRGH